MANICEARCLKCGEIFNPTGEEDDWPETAEHYYSFFTGEKCKGVGLILGWWGLDESDK